MDEKQLMLYAVTDRAWTGRYRNSVSLEQRERELSESQLQQALYRQVEQALLGGVTCVQLREKMLDEAAFIEEAVQIKKLCHRYKVPLIINDNLTVARKSGADGVHVGVEDMSVESVRRKTGKDFIIGATAKTIEQAECAEEQGADYLGVGAVFESTTKKDAIGITQGQLREICGSVSIPAVAIGGITYENMPQLKGCGMKGVALVSAVFSAEDITGAVRRLKRQLINVLEEESE